MSEELNTPTDEALNNRIPLSLLEVFFIDLCAGTIKYK